MCAFAVGTRRVAASSLGPGNSDGAVVTLWAVGGCRGHLLWLGCTCLPSVTGVRICRVGVDARLGRTSARCLLGDSRLPAAALHGMLQVHSRVVCRSPVCPTPCGVVWFGVGRRGWSGWCWRRICLCLRSCRVDRLSPLPRLLRPLCACESSWRVMRRCALPLPPSLHVARGGLGMVAFALPSMGSCSPGCVSYPPHDDRAVATLRVCTVLSCCVVRTWCGRCPRCTCRCSPARRRSGGSSRSSWTAATGC